MEILLGLVIGIAMLFVIDFINNLIEYFWIAGPSDDKEDKKIRGDIISSYSYLCDFAISLTILFAIL